MRALFKRLRKHNLKLSPSKAGLGGTGANRPLHFDRGCVSERRKSIRVDQMPMPRHLKQVHALMGGVGYYRRFLRDLSKRIRPITSLLRKEVKFLSSRPPWKLSSAIFLAELAAPPI